MVHLRVIMLVVQPLTQTFHPEPIARNGQLNVHLQNASSFPVRIKQIQLEQVCQYIMLARSINQS